MQTSKQPTYPENNFLLVDGMAMVFRGYYAIPKLSSRDGTPTNALYGFFLILFNLINQLKPERIAICFDRKETTQRKEAFAEYKANRKAAPDELLMQIPLVKEGVKAFNANLVELAGYEADDLIATIAINKGTKEKPAVIYTSDLDILQLVNQNSIFVLTPHNQKNGIIIDENYVKQKYGFSPTQIPDYKGLHGDPSDNLPGIKGVGKKTASKLLADYESLENIYNNLSDLSKKQQEKFIEHKEVAHLCKELATLHTDLQYSKPESDFLVTKLSSDAMKTFLDKYDLRTLHKKLQLVEKNFNLKTRPENQMELF